MSAVHHDHGWPLHPAAGSGPGRSYRRRSSCRTRRGSTRSFPAIGPSRSGFRMSPPSAWEGREAATSSKGPFSSGSMMWAAPRRRRRSISSGAGRSRRKMAPRVHNVIHWPAPCRARRRGDLDPLSPRRRLRAAPGRPSRPRAPRFAGGSSALAAGVQGEPGVQVSSAAKGWNELRLLPTPIARYGKSATVPSSRRPLCFRCRHRSGSFSFHRGPPGPEWSTVAVCPGADELLAAEGLGVGESPGRSHSVRPDIVTSPCSADFTRWPGRTPLDPDPPSERTMVTPNPTRRDDQPRLGAFER